MSPPPSWLTWTGILTSLGVFFTWLGFGPLRELSVWLAKRFKEWRLTRRHLEIGAGALANYQHTSDEPSFVAIPITNRFNATLEKVSVSVVLSRRNPDLEIEIPRSVVYFVDNRRVSKIKGTLGTLRDGDTARVITTVHEDLECSYALKETDHRVALVEGNWTCELTALSDGKRIGKRKFKALVRYPGVPLFTESRSALGRFFFP
jgi:hypothetical protein